MPKDSAQTRLALLASGCRSFARDGIFAASLLEINTSAGQRNRGAIHYHFGSRDRFFAAIIDQQGEFLRERQFAYAGSPRSQRLDVLPRLIDAMLWPTLELSERDELGAHFLMILDQVVTEGLDSFDPVVRGALAGLGCGELVDRFKAELTDLPESVAHERMVLMASFVIGAIAGRARRRERAGGAAPDTSSEDFADNLVLMAEAMLTADSPLPEVVSLGEADVEFASVLWWGLSRELGEEDRPAPSSTSVPASPFG